MSINPEVPLEEALSLGIRNLQQGNTIVAEQVFRDILKAAPDHYDSLYQLGLSCYYNGKLEEAAEATQKAIDVDDTEPDAWNNLAVFKADLGQKEDALAAWEKAIQIDPEFPGAYGNRANTLWELGRNEEAETSARKAVELRYNFPDAWLNLGNALMAQDKFDDAMEAWEEAVKIKPDYAQAWNNMGNALREQGRLQESEENCRKALELNPNYAFALNNLANAVRDLGRPEEAEDLYRKAINLEPNYPQAQNNLCVCLIDLGRFEEAVVAARYATSFKPDYAEAYINMSTALCQLAEIEQAEKAAQKALALNPESASAHIQIANVLFMRDRYADAEAILKKAQEMEPDSPRLYLQLAQIQENAQKLDEALESVNKAVELNPEMPDAYYNKGSIMHMANRLDEALAAIEKAIELRPEVAGPYATIAEIYQSKGDMKKSEEYIAKAKELNPNMPGIYNTLSKLKKFTKDDEDFKKLMELKENIGTRGLNYDAALNYALFEAYEDVEDYENSFVHLKAANDAKRQILPYDRKMQRELYAQIKQQYTPEILEEYDGQGYPSDIPVFICGMPRSGTTLTEQIISSHPDVYGAGELNEMPLLDRKFGALSPDNVFEKGESYVNNVKKLDPSGKAKRITDKMPGNFLRIGEIVSILPDAKIIHCRRDPVATCLSCYKQNFARGQYWSYNLEELAEQHNLYRDLMDYWREMLPDQFLDIDYEETVGNFEEQARKLIDFVGLEWNDACLEPHKQKRDVLTASKTQVIKPVYQTSIAAWKRYEKQLEPLITGLEQKELAA